MASSTTSTDLITLKPEMRLKTIEDLRALTSGAKFKVEVANTYGKIDLHDSFESFVDAGIMLEVACAAADGQNCRKDVVGVMSDYQDVVHSNLVTCNKFILNSISALDNHRRAIEFLAMLEQGDDITLEDVLEPVLDALADCYDVAANMSSEADAAAKLVGNLSTKAAGALKQATDDHTTNTKKNEETQQKIDELAASTEAMEELITKYQKKLLELQGEKVQAAKDAQVARDRQFALDLTEGIFSHMGDVADAFVKCINPGLSMADSAGENILGPPTTGSEEGKTPTAPTAGVPISGAGANSQIDDLEGQVAAQETLVDGAKKAENSDTADGKKKIQDQENILEALKNSLKTAKDMWSDMTKNQQGVAQSIQEKESMLSKMYYEMAEKEMAKAQQQKMDLATLSTMKVNKTELERTIFLLGFTMGIMGEVKTTFLNCKTFWELLAEQCKLLADCKKNIIGDGSKMLESKVKERIYKEQFRRGVTNGAYRWASVGRVCIDAYDGIVHAKDTVDDAMSNLIISPIDLDDAIRSLAPRIQSKIELHRAAVENGKKVGLLTEA